MGGRVLFVRYEGGWPVGCMTAAEWAERLGCDRQSVYWGATPKAQMRAKARSGFATALEEIGA